jgi:DNA invertase Pin-like site-specific DNA recombinase
VSLDWFRDGFRDDRAMTAPAVYDNSVRIGYARVSTRTQDHQAQLDALSAAHCREVVVETASTRGERPKLLAAMDMLKPGDTLVIYKPDRVARSMKELLVLLEDQLHARGINLHILSRTTMNWPAGRLRTLANGYDSLAAADVDQHPARARPARPARRRPAPGPTSTSTRPGPGPLDRP